MGRVTVCSWLVKAKGRTGLFEDITWETKHGPPPILHLLWQRRAERHRALNIIVLCVVYFAEQLRAYFRVAAALFFPCAVLTGPELQCQ
jgi:hypothetical protein